MTTSDGPRDKRPTGAVPQELVSELIQRIEVLAAKLDAAARSATAGPGTGPPPQGGTPKPGPPDDGGTVPDDGDDPRRVAHELLGQAHAVLVLSTRADVLPLWCPGELLDSVRGTTTALAAAVGEAHAAVGGGEHDGALLNAGIGGALGRPKRRGLRQALRELAAAVKAGRVSQTLSWLKSAAGWAKNALDSFASLIPGAEVLKEALEVVLTSIDTTEALAGQQNQES